MNLTRRAFLRSTAAVLAISASGTVAAQDRFDFKALMDFWPVGQITLMHIGPLMGQMMPHYQRAPEVRIGVGDAAGKVPYLTGEAFRIRYGIGGRTPMDYAHTHEHFVEHARAYGKMGGLDRVATVLNAIRAERPGALFLSHWNHFGYRQRLEHPSNRLNNHASLKADALGSCVYRRNRQGKDDNEQCVERFNRGGLNIEVVGGSGRVEGIQREVVAAQKRGVDLIVCLSWLDFDHCRALAQDVPELDIILSGSTPALPEPEVIGKTHVFASGRQGRFVTRIDVDVMENGRVELESKLIPTFSDLIPADPSVSALIKRERAPFLEDLLHVVGQADTLLFRRGSLGSTWDDLICAALMAEFEADIALVGGSRAGRDILPGQDITREDLYALFWPGTRWPFHVTIKGAIIKEILENEVTSAFDADLHRRGIADMVRAGGLGFALELEVKTGERVGDLRLLEANLPLEMDQKYRVAFWGVDIVLSQGDVAMWQDHERHFRRNGIPIWQVLENYIIKRARVGTERVTSVTLK